MSLRNYLGSVLIVGTVFSFSAVIVPAATAEENLNTILSKVEKLVQTENYPKALEELEWAKKEVEKHHLERLTSFLPDTLGGFSGSPVKPQTAMGVMTIERTYSKGAETATVNLTGSTGGASNPIAGLMGMGKMAAAMGAQQPGATTFRIDGRTATLIERTPKVKELMLFLDSGTVVTLKTSNGADIKVLAENLPVQGMDEYLRGQG